MSDQLIETDLANYSIPHYDHGSVLRRIAWFILGNVFINSYLPIPVKLKVLFLRIFGAKIGKGLIIKPKVNIKYPWLLTVHDHVWIGEEVWIDNLVEVTLGSHVCLSQGAMLLTGNHDFTKSSFDLFTGKIVLEKGVWIGAKAVVCPGVSCGSHAVLGISSVAASNLDSYTIYRGNPAIRVKNREITQ